MQQRINLFDHLEKHESIAVSSKQIASAAIATLVIFVFVGLFVTYKTGKDAHRLQLAEIKDENIQAQLTELRAQSTNDSKAIQRTKRLLNQRRKILLSLSHQQQDIGEGFSHHLTGLGRQQLTGLWLSSISLHAGGEQISLKGKMQKASLLPRYLQDLGKEPVFSGLRFQLMKIEQSEKSKTDMQFEISVSPQAKASSEGHEA